jgi:hypothetical protein
LWPIPVIIYSSIVLVNTTAFLYIYLSNKKRSVSLGTLLFYSFFLLIIETVTSTLSMKGINNLYLSHFYFIPQALILGKLFIDHFLTTVQVKIAKSYLVGSLLFLCLQYLISPELLAGINIIEIFLMNYFLIGCSLFYFYNTLKTKRQHKFLMFGVLFYSTLSTSTFLLVNLVEHINIEIAYAITSLHIVLLIIYQLFISLHWLTLEHLSKNGK